MAYEQYNAYKDQQSKLFDLKRQALRTEMDKLAKTSEKQTKTRLAGAGVTDTSGLAQKQMQRADLDVKRNLYQGLGNIGMEQLKTESDQGYDVAKLQIEDERSKKANLDKLKLQSYYGKGMTGETIEQAELDRMKNEEPEAYFSYLTGGLQKEADRIKNDEVYRTKLVDASILEADNPAFLAQINAIISSQTGGRVGEGLGSKSSFNAAEAEYNEAKKLYDAAFKREMDWTGWDDHYVERDGTKRQAAADRFKKAEEQFNKVKREVASIKGIDTATVDKARTKVNEAIAQVNNALKQYGQGSAQYAVAVELHKQAQAELDAMERA